MVAFTATIKKFDEQGEKTGWTYIEIPVAIAETLKPGTRKSFRVKGWLDQFAIKGVALLPMGGGMFIMALNATMRNGIHKRAGATLAVQLEADAQERELPAGFMECLTDEPSAMAQYNRLSKSHQNYFANWITGVKSDAARARRMAQAVTALTKGLNFVQFVRSLKKDSADF